MQYMFIFRIVSFPNAEGVNFQSHITDIVFFFVVGRRGSY